MNKPEVVCLHCLSPRYKLLTEDVARCSLCGELFDVTDPVLVEKTRKTRPKDEEDELDNERSK